MVVEAVTSRPLRSKALRLRRFMLPAGASASMLAVRVLLSSMDSTLVIEACSNSNWRVVAPKVADAALAASIFHFGTYTVDDLKEYLDKHGIVVRRRR